MPLGNRAYKQTAPPAFPNPYLASLQNPTFTDAGSGASTPVKINKVAQPTIPHVPTTRSHLAAVDEDIHMMTVNKAPPAFTSGAAAGGAVDPRMMRMGYAAPPPPPASAARREVPKERVLQPWEREVLERADVKRKATVAQIYFLDYYCELASF